MEMRKEKLCGSSPTFSSMSDPTMYGMFEQQLPFVLQDATEENIRLAMASNRGHGWRVSLPVPQDDQCKQVEQGY